MKNYRSLFIFGFASLLSLALTGCKYERDDRDAAFYNDVGETDIDRRVYASNRKGTADVTMPQQTEVAQTRRHFNEVGETSLDTGSQERPVAVKRSEKTDKKNKPVSMAKPAETQPVVYAKPEAPAIPVRKVPAPAPAPEYRRSVSVGETELGR